MPGSLDLMKPTLIAALLCVAGLVMSCAPAPLSESEATKKRFLETKAKAEQGDPQAQTLLGSSYFHGFADGVQDYTEALKWYGKAAEQNHAEAQVLLSACYFRGWGVEKNFAESYAWVSQATNRSKDVARFLSSLETEMSPQQLAAGKKRSEELRAQIEARLKSGGK